MSTIPTLLAPIPRSRCQMFSLHHQAALASAGGSAAASAGDRGVRPRSGSDPACPIGLWTSHQATILGQGIEVRHLGESVGIKLNLVNVVRQIH